MNGIEIGPVAKTEIWQVSCTCVSNLQNKAVFGFDHETTFEDFKVTASDKIR